MLLWPRLGPEGVGWVYLVSWLKLFAFDRCGKFWTGNNVVVVVVVVVVSWSCSSSCRWSSTTTCWCRCRCRCWCWPTRGVFLDSATLENINSNKTKMTIRVLDVMKSIRSIGNQLGRRPNITNYESCTRTLVIHLQSSSSFFTPSKNGQKKRREQLIYKPGSWVQQLD
jgi:hypothetical protein